MKLTDSISHFPLTNPCRLSVRLLDYEGCCGLFLLHPKYMYVKMQKKKKNPLHSILFSCIVYDIMIYSCIWITVHIHSNCCKGWIMLQSSGLMLKGWVLEVTLVTVNVLFFLICYCLCIHFQIRVHCPIYKMSFLHTMRMVYWLYFNCCFDTHSTL